MAKAQVATYIHNVKIGDVAFDEEGGAVVHVRDENDHIVATMWMDDAEFEASMAAMQAFDVQRKLRAIEQRVAAERRENEITEIERLLEPVHVVDPLMDLVNDE